MSIFIEQFVAARELMQSLGVARSLSKSREVLLLVGAVVGAFAIPRTPESSVQRRRVNLKLEAAGVELRVGVHVTG